ncbi:hypothetical protein EVH22_22915 [Salmonella enterica subsp. enterica serovar Bareilly]|nr:hypothetical protein [Salmonella enterica subsp. enterica serovar Bareilly]
MSYASRSEDFTNETSSLPIYKANYCVCCGGYIGAKSPAVAYEVFMGEKNEKGKPEQTWILMHPSCANAMAQRLITDTWVERREWQKEIISFK